ncbi:MAG: YeeE/YedE family protein [Gammaproteobacteria bacterium]|nr:YeeE/YedE family protein [Gammaproteobacteria bacterium]
MTFDGFFAAQSFFLWSTFIIALIMGMVVNKTNFCTMGAVSDLVNMGDTGRMRAWVLAGTVAMLGVVALEAMGLANLSNSTLPPYRGSEFQWGRYLLGGILFGIGMTLGSGCGNKTLIRIGGGNIKSIFVFVIIAVIAYYMVDPYKQLPSTWYQSIFAPWLGKASISLNTPQDLGSIVGGLFGVPALSMRIALGLIIGAVVLFIVFRSEEFRSSSDNVLAGVVVGLAVLLAWYFSSRVGVVADEGAQSLTQFYGNWDFVMDSAEGKPQNGSTNLLPQSFTFISPIGQTLGYAGSGFASAFLTFGVVSVAGVILGSLIWSLISKSFRIEWFASFKDFYTHVIGGILMGFGGVLGLGCTVGQAITGVSTLALGSFLVFLGIVFGSALTMKIQYYKLVYEEEATFAKAFITAMVDMKLLPGGMRKLDAV